MYMYMYSTCMGRGCVHLMPPIHLLLLSNSSSLSLSLSLSLPFLHSQHSGGKLKYVEQNELYASNPDPDQDLLNPHRDQDIATKLANKSTHCKEEEGAKPIVDSLKGTKLPDSVLEPVFHARSMAMSNFPSDIKPVLSMDEADEFVAQRDKMFADMMKRKDSASSVASSPVSALSPDSGTGSLGGASPAATSRGSVTSRNGSLSSSSVASPLSSVSSPPISPPTQSSAAPSPNTPALAQAMDNSPIVSANGQYSNGQTRLASVPTSVAAPSPNALASAQQADTPPLLGANGHISGGVNGVPQTKLASVPSTAATNQQGQFTQLQRERPIGGGNTDQKGVQEYFQMLTAPSTTATTTNPVVEDQNGVQSPPSVGSSLSSVSSPPGSTGMSATQQQQQQQGYVSDGPGQSIGNGSGSFSETPSPYNSAVSAVSSPPSVFSPPESNMGTGMLHSAVSTDSIPSVGSALPFQNFHTPSLIPQPASVGNSFSTQIPSNFNFNGTTTSAYHPTSTTTSTANLQNSTSFAANFDSFLPENQMFDNSNPLLSTNDPVMHQLLSDIVALSSDPSFNAVNSVPATNGTTAANVNTTFTHTHPQAPGNYYNPFAPPNNNLHAPAVIPPPPPQSSQPNSSSQANNTFAMSCDIALTQLNVGDGGGNGMSRLLADPQAANSNPEVQDILQQFQ